MTCSDAAAVALRRCAADLLSGQRGRDALPTHSRCPASPARHGRPCQVFTARCGALDGPDAQLLEFDPARLGRLRERQIEGVHCLDGVFEQLYDLLPAHTYVTVTADHGGLFGEDGYFGHGPSQHGKLYEVPCLEGRFALKRRCTRIDASRVLGRRCMAPKCVGPRGRSTPSSDVAAGGLHRNGRRRGHSRRRSGRRITWSGSTR